MNPSNLSLSWTLIPFKNLLRQTILHRDLKLKPYLMVIIYTLHWWFLPMKTCIWRVSWYSQLTDYQEPNFAHHSWSFQNKLVYKDVVGTLSTTPKLHNNIPPPKRRGISCTLTYANPSWGSLCIANYIQQINHIIDKFALLAHLVTYEDIIDWQPNSCRCHLKLWQWYFLWGL